MKKIYFHKELILPILFFGMGTFFLGKNLINNPKAIFSWVLFILCLALFALTIYSVWFYRYSKKPKPPSKEDLKVEFENNQIIFPKGYYYKYSNVRLNKILKVENINEINLNTSPPSFVLNENEVIFIPYKLKDKLEEFGRTNQIPIENRFDIWSAINEPFLDTEFDDEYTNRNLKNLIKNGVPKEEVEQIRKKIRFTMLSSNSVVWEWINLSQFDYLNWTWLTKKKYWWSMEIALRNYKK